MRELRFDGLSPDGTRLILAGKDGQKWSVVIDERIEAAVRRDRARIGQVEIEQAGMLRPREIQARIRSGQTAEDVAAASGLPIEHIRRFEGPVLTERAWVAQQAQSTEVRRPGGDIELGDLVSERLHSEGVDPSDILWDAWRRDDGTWVVIATFPLPPNTHVATWTYDSTSRTMTVVDDNARSLSAIDPEAPLRLAAARPMLASVEPLVDTEEDDEPAVVSPMPVWGRGVAAVSDDRGVEEDADDLEADQEWADSADDELSAQSPEVDVEEREDPHALGVDAPAPEGESVDDAAPVEEFPTDSDDDFADAIGGPADTSEADTDFEDSSEGADTPEDDQVAADGPTADAEDVPLFETPATPAPRPTGKPSVPSFDDILFGPGPGK
jgi:hypothetical protein